MKKIKLSKHERKEKRKSMRDMLIEKIKSNKATFAVYVILRLLVIATLVLSIFGGRFENAFICGLTLVLLLVPAFFQKNFGIELPSTLHIIVLLFIFAAEILGEINCYYIKVPHWDTMLHTMNGFLCAAVGFSLVDLLNRNNKAKFHLSPIYLTMVAFCFSMTIGVLWEMFEFSGDMLLQLDMQKDTVVHQISTVVLDETKSNIPVIVKNIHDVTLDGRPLGVDGYIDIGLIDTMKDLIVNLIGAIVFSVIGFFYVKSRGKSKFASSFIPTVVDETKQKTEE